MQGKGLKRRVEEVADVMHAVPPQNKRKVDPELNNVRFQLRKIHMHDDQLAIVFWGVGNCLRWCTCSAWQ